MTTPPRPEPRATAVRHAVVVVPARDEASRVGRCLRSVRVAAGRVGVPVVVVVADDASTDGTAAVARAAMQGHPHPWDVVAVRRRPDASGVGEVRNAGVRRALELCGGHPHGVWTAHTDADSVVPPDWLSHQLTLARLGADAVVGTIALDPDDVRPGVPAADRRRLVREHDLLVESTRRPDGSHGGAWAANLAVHAEVLVGLGGFPSPAHGEDSALVALMDDDPRVVVARPDGPRVVTSARLRGRAPGGLADLLARLGTTTTTSPATVAAGAVDP